MAPTVRIACRSPEYGYQASAESTKDPNVIAGLLCQYVPWRVWPSYTELRR